MISLSNEQKVWRYLHKCRNGIGVNELSRNTEVPKPTLGKILKKFQDNGDIKKPQKKRGQKTMIILTRFTLKDNFTKMKKQASVIEYNFDQPVITITKDGKNFAGHIDDYSPGIIYLYNCHELHSNKWIPTENQFDHMILLKNISTIYEPNYDSLELEKISLKDVMKLWLDSSHDIVHGIYCPWPNENNHSKECHVALHESLVNLYTTASKSTKSQKEDYELEKSMENILLYLLRKGATIPFANH